MFAIDMLSPSPRATTEWRGGEHLLCHFSWFFMHTPFKKMVLESSVVQRAQLPWQCGCDPNRQSIFSWKQVKSSCCFRDVPKAKGQLPNARFSTIECDRTENISLNARKLMTRFLRTPRMDASAVYLTCSQRYVRRDEIGAVVASAVAVVVSRVRRQDVELWWPYSSAEILAMLTNFAPIWVLLVS